MDNLSNLEQTLLGALTNLLREARQNSFNLYGNINDTKAEENAQNAINYAIEETTKNEPNLLAVKDNGNPIAIYKHKREVKETEILEDMEGDFYYFVEDKAYYLPDNFQPKND